jgi:hypothetical protein
MMLCLLCKDILFLHRSATRALLQVVVLFCRAAPIGSSSGRHAKFWILDGWVAESSKESELGIGDEGQTD